MVGEHLLWSADVESEGIMNGTFNLVSESYSLFRRTLKEFCFYFLPVCRPVRKEKNVTIYLFILDTYIYVIYLFI